MREDAGDRPPGYRLQLALDQRPDLGLRLGDGEVERQRRDLVGGTLVADELVPHLWAVPVRDDELGLGEQRLERGARLAQVRALLGRRAALARADERVPAQRYDRAQATAAFACAPVHMQSVCELEHKATGEPDPQLGTRVKRLLLKARSGAGPSQRL